MQDGTPGVAASAPAAVALSDLEAFERVIQQHKQRIYTYICRLTNRSPEAEDLTQEVFVRAFKSMRAFRHDAQVDTWLYRIATNLVIDRKRREKRAPRWVSVDDEESEAHRLESTAPQSRPQEALETRELQAQVQAAVHSLPTKLRLAAVLCDLEGLSYQEAAEALGCPVGTIKSRLFHARALLKRKLRPYLEQ